MKLVSKLDHFLERPLARGGRFVLAALLSPIIFLLGIQKYAQNDVFMPFWQRDYSSWWHGLTGLGSTDILISKAPEGVVGLIAAVLVGFMLIKALAYYPRKINLYLALLVVLDFLVVAVLVNIFLFSGSSLELIYYLGAFAAGVYLFGDRITSQMALLMGIALILIRLIYIDGIYPYTFWIPVLSLVYLVARAPFNSESYREELENFSLSKMIGRS